MMTMKVTCTIAPSSYESFQLRTGVLTAQPPPQLGYTFTLDEPDAGHVAAPSIFITTSLAGWRFVSRAEDPIIEAARDFVPEHPTKPSIKWLTKETMIDLQGRFVPPEVTAAAVQRLRSFVGKRAKVLKASGVPHSPGDDWRHVVGHEVYVHSQARPGDAVTLRFFSQDISVLEHVAHLWEFEDPIVEAARDFVPEHPTKPSIKQREHYDSEAFGEDLELAINHVRTVVREEYRREFSQPVLPAGVLPARATYLVCLSLMERKLGEDFDRFLEQVLDDARVLLISKNRAYGNSALDPVRLFSKASLKEQLLVRLDDKVSRLARGQAAGEDVAADMLGYLLLVSIAERREKP